MLTAILAFAFVWSLFYERIPPPFLLPLCVGLGAFLAFTRRHKHAQILPNDVLAQVSRLKTVNSALKFWTLFALMVISVASKNPYTGAFLMLTAFIFAVFVSGVSVHHYVQIMVLPVSFLLVGGLALLFEVSSGATGILNFNVFGLWFVVSTKAQQQSALIISRAFGAVSCLCLLSITTPMPDIISVLRRAHCPDLIIDLMYLIYRYVFILMSMHHEMRDAAKSRLGFKDYRTSLRATGKIYSNLFARSYQFASKNFDAMESRCYDTGIRFLENSHKLTFIQVSVSTIFLLVSFFLCLLPL